MSMMLALWNDPLKAADQRLPPVDLSGRIGVLLRQIVPDEGEDIVQQSYTGELIGRSYVWQPWFGNWQGRLAGSWSAQEGSTDSSGLVLSGGGELNLFHLSRFPFQAFVDVRDSRVDIDDALDPGTEERFIRYGIRQSYRSPTGRVSAHFNLFRDERENLITGDRETGNRFISNGTYNLDRHAFNASLVVNDTSRSLASSDQFDWQGDLSHTYTPGPNFTITTSLGAGEGDSSSAVDDSSNRRVSLGTNFLWSAQNLPLSLRGDFTASYLRQAADVAADRNEDNMRGSLSLLYLPDTHWRFGVDLGARQRSGDIEELITFQGASVNYNSRAYPLLGFNYSFGTGAGLRNETNSRTEDEQVYRGNFAHNLNRSWLFDWGIPVNTSLTIGQDLNYERGSLQGDLTTMVHRLSFGFSATGRTHSSSLNFIAYDARNDGRDDRETQSISLNGIHNRRLSRYSDLSLTYNINFSQQSSSDFAFAGDDDLLDEREKGSEQSEYTALEAIYRHNRLFSVRNLRFQSRLRGSVNSLLIDDLASAPSGELLWENRVDYSIGKLEINFRTTWVERPAAEGGGSKTVLLSVNRHF